MLEIIAIDIPKVTRTKKSSKKYSLRNYYAIVMFLYFMIIISFKLYFYNIKYLFY